MLLSFRGKLLLSFLTKHYFVLILFKGKHLNFSVPSNLALFSAYFNQRKAFNVPSKPELFTDYFIQRKDFAVPSNLAFARTELFIKSIFHASRRCYIALSLSGSYSLRRSLLRDCSLERTLEPAIEFSSTRKEEMARLASCMQMLLCNKRSNLNRIATRLFARIL